MAKRFIYRRINWLDNSILQEEELTQPIISTLHEKVLSLEVGEKICILSTEIERLADEIKQFTIRCDFSGNKCVRWEDEIKDTYPLEKSKEILALNVGESLKTNYSTIERVING